MAFTSRFAEFWDMNRTDRSLCRAISSSSLSILLALLIEPREENSTPPSSINTNEPFRISWIFSTVRIHEGRLSSWKPMAHTGFFVCAARFSRIRMPSALFPLPRDPSIIPIVVLERNSHSSKEATDPSTVFRTSHPLYTASFLGFSISTCFLLAWVLRKPQRNRSSETMALATVRRSANTIPNKKDTTFTHRDNNLERKRLLAISKGL